MLFEIEPDRSITGGAWYSGKEFESEFVEILNEQCYHYLCERKEELNKNPKYANDPILKRNASFAADVLGGHRRLYKLTFLRGRKKYFKI